MRMWCLMWGAAVLAGVSGGAKADFPEPVEQWIYDAGEPVNGETELFPDARRPTHVLVSTLKGTLHLVDGRGRRVWTYDLGEALSGRPAVGDLDGDGEPEVVVATTEGRVVALSPGGASQGEPKLLWSYRLSGRVSVFRMPALTDLDNDGKLETIVTDDAGWVVCLSPTGKRRWRFTIDKYRASAPGIGDLDGDGSPEIVYGTENDRTICLTPDGQMKWIRHFPAKFGRGAPTLGDLDGDGYPDVITNHSFTTPVGKLIALDGPTGQLKWTYPLQMWAYCANAIADLDDDGAPEVVTADRSNTIYCLNHDGTQRWKITRDGRSIFHAPAIADLDGDGHVEIVYAPRGNVGWGVLSDQGELLHAHRGYDSNSSPLVGDLDGDDQLDLLIVSPKQGKLYSYTFGGSAKTSRVLWPTKRFDVAHTGLAPSKPPPGPRLPANQIPSDLFFIGLRGDPRWGTNDLFIDWPKDLPGKVLVELSVGSQAGWTTTRVTPHERHVLPKTLPVTIDQPGRNDIRVTIWDETESKPLAVSATTLVLKDFSTFESHLAAELATMAKVATEIAGASPSIARGLAGRSAARVGQLKLAKARVSNMADLPVERRDVLVADLDRLARDVARDAQVAATIARLRAAGDLGPVFMWADPNPWDESHPVDELDAASVSASASAAKVAAYLYRNEVESRVVNLLNVTAETISVQCRLPKERGGIELSEVIPVPRRSGEPVDDALPRLNEANTITLPPGEPRRLWIRCDAGNGPAGSRTVEIEILPLTVNATPLHISVVMEVADIDLAAAPEFLFCNWTSPGHLQGNGFKLADIRRAVADGMTLITLGAPAGRLDAKGDLVEEPNWAGFDVQLDVLEKRCFLLLNWGVSAPKALSKDSDAYIRGFGKAMRALADHLKEKGWPLDRWALYPVDEPGLFQGANMRRFVEIATRYKKAAPEIQVYSNPAGGVTEESFAEIKKLCDVWSPELGLLIRQPELVPFFKRGGERVFCYEAPGDAKSLRPLGYYRGQSWVAFQFGLEGAGYWVYTGDDLWKSHTRTEYGVNYGTAGVLVHSRRWAATRDGIEDVRAFRLLEKLADEADAAGQSSKLVSAARALLKQRIPDAIHKSYVADDITRNLFNYDPDYAEVLAIRKAVGDLTLQLLTGK